jgi:hypothetical protein
VQLLRERGTMPLPVLLKADHESPEYNEDTRASILYAQSWALVHFLLTEETGNGPRQINTFLALLGQGVRDEDAIVRAFGDLKRLEKDLDDYIRQYVRYGVGRTAPVGGDRGAGLARPVPGQRGGFGSSTAPQRVAALLDEALRLDPTSPPSTKASLLAWREGSATRRGRPSRRRRRWTRRAPRALHGMLL